jgi:signal transduction histidine kinase
LPKQLSLRTGQPAPAPPSQGVKQASAPASAGPSAAPTAGWRRSAHRDALLSGFGLAVVATILAGLAGTSVVALHLVHQHLYARAEQSAPAVMSFLTEIVRHTVPPPGDRPQQDDTALLQPDTSKLSDVPNPPTAPPCETLRRLVADMARIPDVNGCRLTLTAPDGPPRVIEPAGQKTPAGFRLTAELRERGSLAEASRPPYAVLDVWFADPASPTVLVGLWSAAGVVGVLSLIAFALIYRALRRRIRPITFVRDNLLAYAGGTEKSLKLLAVQSTSEPVAQAWNALIGFADEMQRDLDALRCRESVAHSMKTLQLQSSQGVMDALPIGLARIDALGRFAYFNYSAARMLHIRDAADGEESIAARLADPTLAQRLLALRDGGGGAEGHAGMTAIDHELQPPEPGGSERGRTTVRLTPIPVADVPDDELVVMVQDVSQLIEAAKSRDAFLAHITHELRTPLTNIRAYAETLSEDFFDDEQTRRECYNVIMSETRRLSRLIEDVLSVSQIEAGASRFERVAVRLDQSLRQAVQDVQANADAKQIELGLRIPSKVPDVLGDRMRLQQVWINLLGNAVKYTPQGGSVTLAIQSDDQTVRVCVTDTGIGIAPEHQEKVFEKFYRVQGPDVEAIEGSGLGLAITQEIVRMHGGTIRLESELGSGSTFIVELPRAREADSAVKTGAAHGADRDR